MIRLISSSDNVTNIVGSDITLNFRESTCSFIFIPLSLASIQIVLIVLISFPILLTDNLRVSLAYLLYFEWKIKSTSYIKIFLLMNDSNCWSLLIVVLKFLRVANEVGLPVLLFTFNFIFSLYSNIKSIKKWLSVSINGFLILSIVDSNHCLFISIPFPFSALSKSIIPLFNIFNSVSKFTLSLLDALAFTFPLDTLQCCGLTKYPVETVISVFLPSLNLTYIVDNSFLPFNRKFKVAISSKH